MTAALKAGVAYFAVVYAIGFLLGTVRVLLLAPLVGETMAVLFEAPIMLLISWIAARWSSGTFSVPAKLTPRLVMGGFAFVLLILGELAVSTLVFDRSWEGTAAAYRSPAGLLGLLAQLIFALLPAVQAILHRDSRR
jgi:hypothetical protein